jgi:diguanylate cyclase (GGDEF)-like protein
MIIPEIAESAMKSFYNTFRQSRPWLQPAIYFGVAMIAAIWAIVTFHLAVEYNRSRLVTVQNTSNLARVFEEHIVGTLMEIDRAIVLLRTSYRLTGNLDLANSVTNPAMHSDLLTQVRILGPDGALVAASSEPILPGVNFSDREYFQVHLNSKTDDLFISKPIFGRTTGKWLLQLSRPIRAPDDSYRGVIGASLDPSYLAKFYQLIDVGQDGAIFLAGLDGFVRASAGFKNDVTGGSMLGSKLFDKISEADSGSFLTGGNQDGIKRFVSYRVVNGFPLVVYVGLAEHEVLANYWYNRSAYFAVAALATLFIMLVVGLAVRYRGKLNAAELEARNQARHDPLTGLPNHRFFVEKLDECLLDASDTQRLAILMLDLDGFKTMNDTHGHAVGDKALGEFTHRVTALLRADSVLARIGGDEFAIIMPKIDSLDDPTNLARRIAAVVAEPLLIGNVSAEFGVGVGIAIAPHDGTDPDELFRRADRALYRAKAAGRSSVRFFEPEMDAHVERSIQVERELRAAIASNAVVPYYQPIVSRDGNRIIGFEALARWKSEALGDIPPDVFIPIAEETGLINVLGGQLLRRACLDANAWPASFNLAFNVSPIQLRDPMLGLRIRSILRQTGFSPDRLELEITESALVQNIGIAQTVTDDLRRAGVRIALDDFGTGYAALTQLLSLHLDKIKIDRSFVSRLDQSEDSRVIVRAILGIAKGFGLTTTAEGVEDAAQLACLKAFGCAEAQGYLFGRAVPAAAIPALLSRASNAFAAA